MKVLIPILIGLLVVGCGKAKQDVKESPKETPVKELTKEDVVGTYESDGPKAMVDAGEQFFEYRMDLLNDGTFVHYLDDEKSWEGRWVIKGNEIHQTSGGMVLIYRITPDKSLTNAEIKLGTTLLEITEDKQYTYKKIKSEIETPSKVDDNNSTEVTTRKLSAEEEKVVGEYVLKIGETHIFRNVLLENGICEVYINGKKDLEAKWKVVDGEIHSIDEFGDTSIDRINKDGSITTIAEILDGKRRDWPKEKKPTYKKIK